MYQLSGVNRIHIKISSEMETAVRILKEHAGVVLESVMENEVIITNSGTDEEISALIGALLQNKVILTGFYKEEGNLESLFMQLTGGGEPS